jgi:hypothetical protein
MNGGTARNYIKQNPDVDFLNFVSAHRTILAQLFSIYVRFWGLPAESAVCTDIKLYTAIYEGFVLMLATFTPISETPPGKCPC